jgi:putative membrane protein
LGADFFTVGKAWLARRRAARHLERRLTSGGACLADFFPGLLAFFAYFFGAIGFVVLFCAIYTRLTPYDEFDLIVRQHNASAGLAFGGALIGFALALAGAIHNTLGIVEFGVWGLVALISQMVAYGIARLLHPGLSHAIEQNAMASAYWIASVSISAGLIAAACMSP